MKYIKPAIKIIKLQCESFLAASYGVDIDDDSGTITLDPSQAITHSDHLIEGDSKISTDHDYWGNITRNH
ncbi:MAG: hypothetical protein LKE54_10185 [Prevotella sp.]|jgi:hypothetical protein|nr:hypothetical protein [Prevotella sp.]MCH3995389.1 hypothetical protein [Prevotella sp.]